MQFIDNIANVDCVCSLWRRILSLLKRMATRQSKCAPALYHSLQQVRWTESYVFQFPDAPKVSLHLSQNKDEEDDGKKTTKPKTQMILRVSGARELTVNQEMETKIDGSGPFVGYQPKDKRLLFGVERDIKPSKKFSWDDIFYHHDIWQQSSFELDAVSGEIVYLTHKFYNISKVMLQGCGQDSAIFAEAQFLFPNCDTLWVVAQEGELNDFRVLLRQWKPWDKVKKLYVTSFYDIPSVSEIARSFPSLVELHLIRSTCGNSLRAAALSLGHSYYYDGLMGGLTKITENPYTYRGKTLLPTSIPYYPMENEKIKKIPSSLGVTTYLDEASSIACGDFLEWLFPK